MDTLREEECIVKPRTELHPLFDKWVLWAHLPHDTDWTIKSYKPIMELCDVEDILLLYNNIPPILVKNCMLFLMRKGITPTWEDVRNRDGGCFSYKISNKTVYNVWKELSFLLVGETISNDPKFVSHISGITISPKKMFCIIKIWMENCSEQNPKKIKTIRDLSPHGCLFKRHKPEY